jgi:hypothetical protein
VGIVTPARRSRASNGAGGAISAERGRNLSLTEDHFAGNIALEEGGAVAMQSGRITAMMSTMAGNFGGAIYLDSSRTHSTIHGALIDGNSAAVEAGGIFAIVRRRSGIGLEIVGSVIERNRAGGPVSGISVQSVVRGNTGPRVLIRRCDVTDHSGTALLIAATIGTAMSS